MKSYLFRCVAAEGKSRFWSLELEHVSLHDGCQVVIFFFNLWGLAFKQCVYSTASQTVRIQEMAEWRSKAQHLASLSMNISLIRCEKHNIDLTSNYGSIHLFIHQLYPNAGYNKRIHTESNKQKIVGNRKKNQSLRAFQGQGLCQICSEIPRPWHSEQGS